MDIIFVLILFILSLYIMRRYDKKSDEDPWHKK
jgi:hypothetical protein